MAIRIRKSFRLVAALLFTSLLGGVQSGSPVGWVTPAVAQTVSVDIFFEPLAKHGRWLSASRYGYVWVPERVTADWRPYTHGRWEYTRRFGWMWISNEDWGWATYHYGRWGYDDDYGWFWVPGNRWAPAWVSWQTSDDYFGWAPLPPSGSGYAFSASIGTAAIGIGAWRFVLARDFLSPNLGARIIAPSRNAEVIRRTRSAGPVRVVNKVVVNNVINVTNVERSTKQKVVVRDIREVRSPQDTKAAGDSIQVYRPQIGGQRPRTAPKDVVEAKKITDRAATVKVDAPAQGRGRPTEPAPGQKVDGNQPAKTKSPATGDKAGEADAPAKSKQPRAPVGGREPKPAEGKAAPKRLPEKSAPKAAVPETPKTQGVTQPLSKGNEKASPSSRTKATPEGRATSAPGAATKQSQPKRPVQQSDTPATRTPKRNPNTEEIKAAPQGKGDAPPGR